MLEMLIEQALAAIVLVPLALAVQLAVRKMFGRLSKRQ